jgi:hypothetical protein
MAPIIPIIDVEGEALCIGIPAPTDYEHVSKLDIVILEEGSTPLPILDLAARVRPHLGSALGARLDLMGQISLFNLATAITALHIGVPGRLTIEVPSRAGGRIEIDWQPASRTITK